MEYMLSTVDSIIRLKDSASIPKDVRNRDYREYLEWFNEGNTPSVSDNFKKFHKWDIIKSWYVYSDEKVLIERNKQYLLNETEREISKEIRSLAIISLEKKASERQFNE